MGGHSRRGRSVVFVVSLAGCLLAALELSGQVDQTQRYRTLAPVVEGKLTLFPVVGDKNFNTDSLISLEQGVQSADVSISEGGRPGAFVRPRRPRGGRFSDRHFVQGPQTNEPANHLVFTNKSNQVLLLLAGEIVIVGKQNRIVAKDYLVPAHSKPTTLEVFYVEPPLLTPLDAPVQQSYEQFFGRLRLERPLGAVVAVDRQLIWVDVFASPSLFAKYWPKLIRSYAGENVSPHARPAVALPPVTQGEAQEFLEQIKANQQAVTAEPGVYRYTEFSSDSFKSFLLTGLTGDLNFDIHVAKIERWSDR